MASSGKILLAFVFLGVPSILCAQAPPPRTVPESKPVEVPPNSPSSPTSPGAVVFKPVFHLLDSDDDGWISRREAESVPDLAKDFGRYDLNRDGKLDRAEFERYAATKK